MERRSVLTLGAAGAAALITGGVSLAAAPAMAETRKPSSAPSTLRGAAALSNLAFGSALTPQDIEQWPTISGGQFSVVTPANAMKWDNVEPTTQGVWDWTGADQLVAFAKANDQLVRGHCILWHNQIPGWLTTGVANGTISQKQLWNLVETRIFTELGRYRGKIWQWDIANEFFTDSDPSGIDQTNWWVVNAGEGIIAQAFKWAHEADPHALLFYNDYNITGEDGTNAKFDAVFNWVSQQRDAGVPIQGIGTQTHLDTQYGFNPQQYQTDLETYAKIGLKLAVTELDVRTFVDNATDQTPTSNLALFAQPYEYSAVIQAALSVPEVISATVWGWTDTDSWVPSTFAGEGYACLYDVNQQPKQAYDTVLKDLQLAGGTAPRRAPLPRTTA